LQVLIIGLGNMGSSLARGLLKVDTGNAFDVIGVDGHQAVCDEMTTKCGIKTYQDIAKAPTHADVIVICVKPQDLAAVAGAVQGKIQPQAVVVSILAGITIGDLHNCLKFSGAIVRGMPNICATISEAATVLCENEFVTDAQRETVTEIFSAVGEVSWSKEAHLDAVTGLSGSGPAYVYMVIEALTDGGVKMGLPRPLALRLATQTVIGAGKLVQESGLHPAILRDRVTTPGGTTIHAIHELEAHGLRAMLISAVVTATEKSADLRKKS
jgi:pyrroline-5-carboxylate reductase